jgi:hypothetical protein
MDAARGVCVAAWRMDFRLPPRFSCISAFRKMNSQQDGQPRDRSSEAFGSPWAGQKCTVSHMCRLRHFLDVPTLRHLIRTSACDDNVAFRVLDSDLALVYGVVRSEKDQAMEDQ